MEKPARSQNTPGTDAAFDLLSEIAVDPTSDARYPDGTVLIPADSPDASALIPRAIDERRPIAVVYPDGREIVAAPRGGALAFFEHLLTRRRESKAGTPAVPLPADYQVEIRDRQALARRPALLALRARSAGRRASTPNLYRIASCCRTPKPHKPVSVRPGMVHGHLMPGSEVEARTMLNAYLDGSAK